jgi:hypothetical protein
MNTDVCSKILRVATYAMSATALAQKLGKSKGYMIADEIRHLVDNGQLVENTSGAYPTYKVAEQPVSTRACQTTARDTTVVADTVTTPAANKLPEGYVVSKAGKRKSDNKVGRKVTLPNGTSYFVENGDTLVNINDGDYVKIITSKNGAVPEAQISTLIEQYTHERSMTAYTIKHKFGSIGRDQAVGVLDYKITKCNKAA